MRVLAMCVGMCVDHIIRKTQHTTAIAPIVSITTGAQCGIP